MNTTKWSLAKTGILAALIGLSAVSTMAIRIPLPVTNGYFNIGDVFVILAGLWLGPLSGLIVGAIGPTIADAIGYPQFMLATFVIKGLEGLIVGLIGGPTTNSAARKFTAGSIGGVVIVSGYFGFEALIYPYIGKYIPFFNVTDIGGALLEIPANIAQAVIGVVGGMALWRLLAKRS